jgi:hypothetical protein
MRPRVPLAAVLTAAAVLLLSVLVPPTASAIAHGERVIVSANGPGASPQAASTSSRHPVNPGQMQVNFDGDFLGWAMLDRASGKIVSARNSTQTSSTESMIKVWLVSDFLRSAAESGQTPSPERLTQASNAIRHSDDSAAQALYLANGGNESVQRMVDICGLRHTSVFDGWWSRTQISPQDAVKLGNCVANGTAAGPEWTKWVLSQMQIVTGTTAAADQQATTGGGRWGIIDGVPNEVARKLAIKNGWTEIGADGNWHLNCLAISDNWTMAVMMRYPIGHGLDYGSGVCAIVARQLVAKP